MLQAQRPVSLGLKGPGELTLSTQAPRCVAPLGSLEVAWSCGVELGWRQGAGGQWSRGLAVLALRKSRSFPAEHSHRARPSSWPPPLQSTTPDFRRLSANLRVHLHRHAQPAAPVQLRLGGGSTGPSWPACLSQALSLFRACWQSQGLGPAPPAYLWLPGCVLPLPEPHVSLSNKARLSWKKCSCCFWNYLMYPRDSALHMGFSERVGPEVEGPLPGHTAGEWQGMPLIWGCPPSQRL